MAADSAGNGLLESAQTVFQGTVLTLNLERVRLPNGRSAELEVAHHPGGAAIVAVDADLRICLLHQYRHAAGRWLWELPAGKIDHREPPIETARRELAEEAGRQAASWVSLGKIFSSPGLFTEIIHLYLASHLTTTPAAPEEHEVFRVAWLPWQQAFSMAESGRIEDGKTLAGLLTARRFLDRARQQPRSGTGLA